MSGETNVICSQIKQTTKINLFLRNIILLNVKLRGMHNELVDILFFIFEKSHMFLVFTNMYYIIQ
jgi:hypothetical protein